MMTQVRGSVTGVVGLGVGNKPNGETRNAKI